MSIISSQSTRLLIETTFLLAYRVSWTPVAKYIAEHMIPTFTNVFIQSLVNHWWSLEKTADVRHLHLSVVDLKSFIAGIYAKFDWTLCSEIRTIQRLRHTTSAALAYYDPPPSLERAGQSSWRRIFRFTSGLSLSKSQWYGMRIIWSLSMVHRCQCAALKFERQPEPNRRQLLSARTVVSLFAQIPVPRRCSSITRSINGEIEFGARWTIASTSRTERRVPNASPYLSPLSH